jgi:Transposase DDE domain group 1
MGEKHHEPFQLSFNSSLRVDFRGSRVTSDGGLIVVRELDEWLGMGALIERYLTDTCRGRNTQLPLADLLRQSVYSRLAGYEDVNDAERVSADPTFRLIGSEKIWERGAALTSRLHAFETALLAKRQGVLFLNPGSAGPRRFKLPVSVARLIIRGGAIDAQLVELAV